MANNKNSEKEIEEAHTKVRGGKKKEEQQKEVKSEKKNKEAITPEKKSVEETFIEEAEETELLVKKPREIIDLEAITKKEPALPAEARDSEYVEQLSRQPMREIYQEIKDIYRAVEEKGYLSPVEQRQVEYLSSAVQRKFEDEEQGTYSFTEQAARAASIAQQLSASMMSSYKGKKMNEMYKS